jgi:hypothetical protein
VGPLLCAVVNPNSITLKGKKCTENYEKCIIDLTVINKEKIKFSVQ